jgi:hypothetical protein
MNEPGEFTKKLHDHIMDIQYGEIEHPWSLKIPLSEEKKKLKA